MSCSDYVALVCTHVWQDGPLEAFSNPAQVAFQKGEYIDALQNWENALETGGLDTVNEVPLLDRK